MAAAQIARALGRRGGRARSKGMTAAERRRVASLGGHARRESERVARRIIDNLRYAAVMIELRGGPVAVRRVKAVRHPLPRVDHRRR